MVQDDGGQKNIEKNMGGGLCPTMVVIVINTSNYCKFITIKVIIILLIIISILICFAEKIYFQNLPYWWGAVILR